MPNCFSTNSQTSSPVGVDWGSSSTIHPSLSRRNPTTFDSCIATTFSRASAGANLPSSFINWSTALSPANSAQYASPVERSQKQTPALSGSLSLDTADVICPEMYTAQIKLFFESSNMELSIAVPGVIILTISRLTNPFANLGSSICSQIAILYPLATILDM